MDTECVVELGPTYKVLFPLIQYKADQAVRKLMQMPVTVVEMCLKGPGSQKLYVLESIPGVNVGKLVTIAEKCLSKSSPKAEISKEMLQDLCNLATAESDRLLIKYACCKGQTLSKKQSIALYGFHDFNHQEEKINNAISELKEMREAVELLGKVKDKAILQGLGLSLSSDESSSVDASSSGSETDTECAWISDNEHDTLQGCSSQNSYPENCIDDHTQIQQENSCLATINHFHMFQVQTLILILPWRRTDHLFLQCQIWNIFC